MSTYKDTRIRNQTNEEWLYEYDGKTSAVTPIFINDIKTGNFRYLTHRTTKKGSVVLEFISLDDNTHAVLFFNVQIKSPRGKSYPAKTRGQFIPPKHGKFRSFWESVVGKPPERWCRVHKSLRSKLSGLVFICNYKSATGSKGEMYFKIYKINVNQDHKVCT